MNISALINAMPILGQGLVGVFFVIAVIWLLIACLTRVFK